MGIAVIKILLSVLLVLSNADMQSYGSIMCYECTIQPPSLYSNRTTRLCSHFDESERYQVECPYSTFCTKKTFQLALQGGRSVNVQEKGCAQQKYTYHSYEEGKWVLETAVEKSIYKEGCFPSEKLGLKTPTAETCYCSSDLCNTGKPTTEASFFHHTDTMAVIFIFNAIKFLRSIQQ